MVALCVCPIMHDNKKIDIYISWYTTIGVAYLLQPTSGGPDAIKAMTHVNAQQASAWSGLKIKLPMGLQITSHLSKATTARDHRLTIP